MDSHASHSSPLVAKLMTPDSAPTYSSVLRYVGQQRSPKWSSRADVNDVGVGVDPPWTTAYRTSVELLSCSGVWTSSSFSSIVADD